MEPKSFEMKPNQSARMCSGSAHFTQHASHSSSSNKSTNAYFSLRIVALSFGFGGPTLPPLDPRRYCTSQAHVHGWNTAGFNHLPDGCALSASLRTPRTAVQECARTENMPDNKALNVPAEQMGAEPALMDGHESGLPALISQCFQ